VIVSAYWHIATPYLSIMTVVIMMTVHRDNTWEQGLERWIGRTLGAILGLLFIYIFIEFKPIYIFIMAFWIVLWSYLYVEQRFHYASLMGAVATAGVMFSGLDSVSNATELTISWIIQIAIGVIVVWLIDYSLWPPRTVALIHEAFGKIFNDNSKLIEGILNRVTANYPKKIGRVEINLDTFSSLSSLISRAKQEHKESEFSEHIYLKLVAYSKRVFLNIQVLDQTIQKGQIFLNNQVIAPKIEEILRNMRKSFQTIEMAMLEKRVIDPAKEELTQSVLSLEEHFEAKRKNFETSEWEYNDALSFIAFISMAKEISADIANINKSYYLVRTGKATDVKPYEKSTERAKIHQKKVKGKLQLHVGTLKKSIKSALCVMLIVFGYLYFKVSEEVGLMAIITVLIITYQANLGMAQLKAKLRFLGCLFGGVYGFIGLIILTQLPHFLILISILFLGLFISTCLSLGSDRVAYAGVQAGLVLPLALLVSNGPPTTIDVAVGRLSGIIIGGATALIVLHFIWPVDPLKQLKNKLFEALKTSGEIFQTLLKLREEDEEKIKNLSTALASTLPKSEALFKDSQYMIMSKDVHADDFIDIIDSLDIIYVEYETLSKAIYNKKDHTLIDEYISFMSQSYNKIGSLFYEIAEEFKLETLSQTKPIDVPLFIKELNDQRLKFRETGITRQYVTEDVEILSVIINSIDRILSSLNKIANSISKINDVNTYPRAVEALET